MRFFNGLINRLTEPSSYASLAAVLAIVGVNVDGEMFQLTANAGVALAALAGFFLKERAAR